jgi:hypothetical protein
MNAAPFFQKLEAFQGAQSRNAIKLLWWTLARTVEVRKPTDAFRTPAS